VAACALILAAREQALERIDREVEVLVIDADALERWRERLGMSWIRSPY